MSLTPVQFAKEFARLKSDVSRQPAGDARLLRLVEFWDTLRDRAGDDPYQSYVDGFAVVLLEHLNTGYLFDLLPVELENVLTAIDGLRDHHQRDSDITHLASLRSRVVTELARKLFHVGATEKALNALGVEQGDEIPAGLDAYQAFRWASDRVSSENVAIREIRAAWERTGEALTFDDANCLFVEKTNGGEATRGRLRTLSCEATYRKKERQSDEVAFDNQMRAPDDPFVGTVHSSLGAVRRELERFEGNGHSTSRIRARFAVRDSEQTFTGDSIGLAAALGIYVQLLRPEIHRYERFLAVDAVFTGGVDDEGALTAVNDETLGYKIERAFFSPLRCLVLPKANLRAAETALNQLASEYPRRRLRLIVAERLSEVIENRNVIRNERVCMGQFVARKGSRLARSVRIQVPLLLILGYLLLSIVYPKAWIGFDRNPEYLMQTTRGFDVYNADSTRLWSHQFDVDVLRHTVAHTGDLNGDGMNEVAYMPFTEARSDDNADLFVYDPRGDLMFRRECSVQGEYPGDTSADLTYVPVGLSFDEIGDRTIITTKVGRSYPARMHIRNWSAGGDSLGWYVNAGYGALTAIFERYSESEEVDHVQLYLGHNNRMRCVALYALHPDSSYGASPPYIDSGLDLSSVTPGNQICYVLFPRSDLNRASHKVYHHDQLLEVGEDGVIRADIREGDAESTILSYYLNDSFRVVSVNVSDRFAYLRNEFVVRGELPAVDWTTYLSAMRDSVRYWTDSGWVTEGALRAEENSN